MEFEQAELDAIERACRAQARADLELASYVTGPLLRNQRTDSAEGLVRIADKIQADRRNRARNAAADAITPPGTPPLPPTLERK